MFRKAIPVWASGCAKEMNCALVFEADIPSLDGCTMRISAYTFYRLYANGEFVAFGPARAAEGYARVDVLDLNPYHRGAGNRIRVEVVGYYCRSLTTAFGPSFFCAEILEKDGSPVCASGTEGDFVCRRMTEKLRHAERYSGQRQFGELWDFSADTDAPLPLTDAPCPVWLPRTAPYPAYRDILLTRHGGCGDYHEDETLPFRENRYSFACSDYWGTFKKEEIADRPYRWIQRQALSKASPGDELPVTLSAGEYALFDFGILHSGFLLLGGRALSACDIVIGYSEYCDVGTFSFTNINMQNVISCRFPAGADVAFQSFEPYTVRNAVILVKSGALILSSFGVKTYEHTMQGARRPAIGDPSLARIYDAALRTFAHNAVDLFSDCPSRERAGWLCDSYFTGAVEHFLFGKTPVEDAFLENYRLYRENPFIPSGMLPMCYPADSGHVESQPYIPQWCMWYVLEVRDYLTERNPDKDPALFRDSVMGVVNFLAGYENEDGLLEDLPGWNFVEWSDANKWVRNVNYPTNFLYAEVLRCTAALYGDTALSEKAERICQTAICQSFDGVLFSDNAVRDENGRLIPTGNASEAGQYYAVLFGGVDVDAPEYAALKHHILTGFADMTGTTERKYVPVNAFIGLYLRIKVLLKLGLYDILLGELDGFFGGMVGKTGTLWEYRQMTGSYDHGFASFAAPAIVEALRGCGKL